jgi:hypothetical protein
VRREYQDGDAVELCNKNTKISSYGKGQYSAAHTGQNTTIVDCATNTYHFIGPKGPTPGLIIERINIELSSFPNPWMLRFTAATVAILIRCRVIVIQRLRTRMIAFQTATVRLKAITEGLLEAVAVAVVFVIGI